MSSIVHKLEARKLIHPPKFLSSNTIYEVLMGSVAYGVSSDTSDMDVYGICIPYKNEIFPHLKGEIPGFGRQKQKFEQFQQHHIKDEIPKKQYDITIYNIVKYFTLAMENNPNIVDSLFVPNSCVLYSNLIGQHIRENRKIFLHKGAFHKFKGYAYSQQSKIKTNKTTDSTRRELIDKYGYDVKYAYHLIRLTDEIEQILTLGDLDLQRAKEQMKSIRRGEWKEQDIYDWFTQKELQLERLYVDSSLPHSPDEGRIKSLLVECLEMHYGSLDKCIKLDVRVDKILDEIEERINLLRMRG